MKRLSLKSKKANVIQKIDLSKKKPIDYTEMAYREAVSKLKYLLAESYVTKPISGKSQGIEDLQYSNIKIHESEEDTDDKSVVLNKSRGKEIPEKIHRITDPHFASCTTVLPTKAFSNLAPSSAGSQSVPPELNSFIEQQEEYIQQLHQESQFCRNQLNNLLHKVREVVAENEALHYKNKTGFFKCALDDYVHIKENDNDNDKQKLIETETSEFKKPKTLEGPNIVFESRISELEAQLTQAKLELRKAQEENQSNLKRLSQSCLNNDTLEIKNQLEKALHAKYEAEMKIEDLQKTVTLVQEKEIEAFQKMKQTVDGMQQMQFEKSQCEVEIKRLKEELDRQHEKIREATQEASKRIAEERKQAERRYSQQVEQLSADITSHWDAANKSQLESEKQRRELTELRRELSQKQTFIDNLKKELQNKITNLQSELNQALTEKDGAEQEVLATKLTAERNERQGRQEQSRLQIEINSYKQRLERTEAELVHLRRENLRLSEHIISLEKEINTNKSIGSDDFTVQTPSKLENEKELTSMIMDMETKHAATVAGLEDALNNQATIVSHLTAECQSLTQRLEANNLKHKEEMVNLQNNIEYLSNKIQSTFSNQEELLKRLNSDEEPLPKRLKLAENAFCTSDLPIVRKEDLILQWLCETCSTDENVWRSIKSYKLKIIFVRDILYPLCNIIDHKCTNKTNRLGAAAHKCVQQLIFGKKYAQDATSFRNESTTQFADLVSAFAENIKSKDFQANLRTFVFIFHAAVAFLGNLSLEYTNLMVSILNAVIHLRHEEKLISFILIAVKHSLNTIPNTKLNMFFPQEFKEKLKKAVNSTTNSQGVSILRTLIYHLKTDCIEVLRSEDAHKNIVIVHITIELLIMLLDSVCVFEYTGTLTSHQKFINAIDDLRNILSLLVDRILHLNHDEKIINKLILQQAKISKNTSNVSFITLNSLVGGLEYFWKSMLKFDRHAIFLLSEKEMPKVADSLLIDMTSSEESFSEWVEVLHNDSLQENKRFVMCLLSSVVTRMENLITKGATKSICKHFVIKHLLEDEGIENQKLNEMVIHMKDILSQKEWVQIENASLREIKVYLQVLLHLPLIHLNANVRLIIFIIIFALRIECNQNEDIISLSNVILSDLLEKPGVHIFQYMDPSLLLCQLSHNRNIQKTLELSLRNGLSYTTLKKLIKAFAHSKKDLHTTIMKMLPSTVTEMNDVNILSSILKINVTNENINKEFKNLVERTLLNIFLNDCNGSEKNDVLKEGLKLAVVVLHNRKIFQVKEQTMKGIWCVLLKYPSTHVLLPLLESSESTELQVFLEHLHDQMVKAITHIQPNDLENVCIIWQAVLKTNMSHDRNRLRLIAIKKLIQIIQVLNVSEELWTNLLKLIQSILATKHLYLSGTIIDMSIFLGLKSLQQSTIFPCQDALTLCNILLKMRTNLITDRLPALLILYRHILNVVVHKSKVMIDKSEQHIFKCIALDIEKFTGSLIKLKKDMARLSPYLIADLLKLFSEASISTSVKVTLQNCINLLIGICDQHGIALLFRILPISMQEIFKTQLDVFNKYYKFSGKI
ncbi:Serologically defined colon cancer antigen 8 like protein [Dufourea novaeangliae]|uniref:Serologically defined colon cancer antigen 8 like protein n=1 Tax=Dufourea novaeangliae TaxID=178035 RepID=A0A154PGG3_DUFNO|nr:Serologically defined colon cancer antigen 8 like protein [Dufourea novaeangliae]